MDGQTGQTILYLGLIAMALVGVLGSFIPAIPGPSLVVLAVVIWGAVKGWALVTTALWVSIAVLVLSLLIDNLAGIIGAQKAGASQWGQIGSIVGLLLGFFGLLPALPIGGPLAGILLGPVLGAVVGEMLYRRTVPLVPRFKVSLKAALGILLGSIIGNVIQGLLALMAAIVFVGTTWNQAM
ncbi:MULTISPECIES: DUF456 domain-containing protein [Limnothrix]|uniref:DUF456 family protein n=1 Tax=Limnothrix redekei LRLZ20PSL1 TaxID=3112953 RepID=A0ABW7C4K5_9CYAN|nr:DUF456 family protein [Limnothrix sp. PR1529]OCQ94958.1 hypothetical protein BCR12_15335 [Limnothrix sp. P13C2]PIB14563.1 hypothetical protein AMR42_05170 [Limnothrix sp. PR1529]